jgi:CubicO group peptidase (beta-lactamase class C family)
VIATTTRGPVERLGRAAAGMDERELRARVDGILHRRPLVGLAVAIVRDGRPESFLGHGLADIASKTPVTEDTVFRIGSLTKTVTAVAVLQLWERGLVDLDAPVADSLRAYRLVPLRRAWRPATIRHLLTHTAGIPEVVRLADLFHPGWGPFMDCPAVASVRAGEPLPSLAAYYRDGLRVVAEPGRFFAYSGHGFATLGQIVEDVSGQPLDRYLREQVFEPLGMGATDLLRSGVGRARLATGYTLGPGGPRAVPDRHWLGEGGGGVYASPRDMARYVAALLGGGANEHGRVLAAATLATMFEPHHQTDARLPSMGLAFFRHDLGGHRLVGHDGIMPGFHSTLLLAPDDGIGVVAFTNGSRGAMEWLPSELERLLGDLLGLPDEIVRPPVPHHPEVWGDLCGRYRLPARVSDLRGRLAMGGGIQVGVRGGLLMARVLAPIPALLRGFPLQPDDETDPHLFRVDLSGLGISAIRVVFRREAATGGRVAHTDLGRQPISFYEQPAVRRRLLRRLAREEGPA